jgi:hypothetical protein
MVEMRISPAAFPGSIRTAVTGRAAVNAMR